MEPENYWNKSNLSLHIAMNASVQSGLESRIYSTMVIGCLVLIIAATVVGNALVIAAILTEKSLQRVQYYLILSLAMADEMVGLLVSPLAVYYNVTQRWRFGLLMCDLWIFFDVLACSASILHLVAIALDRYWSVVDVTYIHRRTKGRIFTMIVVVWSVALLISVPPFFGWKDAQFTDRVNRYEVCLYSQDLVYQIFSTISAFYAPLLLILLLYWRIYVVAQNRIQRERKRKSYSLAVDSQFTEPSKFVVNDTTYVSKCEGGSSISTLDRDQSTLDQSKIRHFGKWKLCEIFRGHSSTVVYMAAEKNGDRRCNTEWSRTSSNLRSSSTVMEVAAKLLPKREARVARTLAIVTGSFIMFWLPFFVLALYRPIACASEFSDQQLLAVAGDQNTSSYCNIPPLLDIVFLWLGYANSALNPIIYTVFSPDFAKAMKRILSKAIFRF